MHIVVLFKLRKKYLKIRRLVKKNNVKIEKYLKNNKDALHLKIELK